MAHKNITPKVKKFYFLFIITISISCDLDYSPMNSNLFPALRPTTHNFSWEIDTLSFAGAFQILPNGIWGSNTNEIWMVARSTPFEAQVWHWNGVGWKPFPNAGYGVGPTDIIGFSSDDIWFVGHLRGGAHPKNSVKHWDGTNWNSFDTGISNDHCYSVWGSASNDIYIGYDKGLIAHYRGFKIDQHYTGNDDQIIEIYGHNWDNVYACGSKLDKKQPWDSTYYYLYHNDGYGWSLINYQILTPSSDKLIIPWRFWGRYPHALFGVNDYGVFVNLKRSEWNLLFRPEPSAYRIHGTDYNNVFVAGFWGSSIHHFNGDTWANFDEFRALDFFGYAIFAIKNHVFIGGHNSYDSNGFVIRGRQRK